MLDMDLIETWVVRGGTKKTKYLVVIPTVGKGFDEKTIESFKEFRLPAKQTRVIVYDNSTGKKRLPLVEYFDSCSKELSYVMVIDRNIPGTIESSADFREITGKCSAVYKRIYEETLPEFPSDYVINLEDDVWIPPGSMQKVMSIFSNYESENIGTVIGVCCDRRVAVMNGKRQPIVVNFSKQATIGGEFKSRYSVIGVPERPFGIEAVGAGHMGFWVSRRELVDEVGMTTDPDESVVPIGHDIQFGLRANEAGYRYLIDWSIQMRHYYHDEDDELTYV